MYMKKIAVLTMALVMLVSAQAFSMAMKGWDRVINDDGPRNIFIENVVNESGDNMVDPAKITEKIKGVFAGRGTPSFNVVNDRSRAEMVFKGTVTEYIWMEKAPITEIYGAGALVMDVATKDSKNFVRMQIDYKVFDAKTDETMMTYVTQVTIKQPDVPKNESYGMIYDKLPKIFSLDIFKRYKKRTSTI
jgi:hypothetical protein